MFFNIKDVHSYYGLSHILFGICLSVNEGEAVVLLGRNGVGKTTTLASIMGFVVPKSGSIVFEGEELIGKETHEIACLGIGIVPEGRRLFAGLSVRENLQIAKDFAFGAKANRRLDDVLDLFPVLKDRENQDAATLSGGEQQMLALARPLVSDSKLVLMDEPTEGLAPLVKHAISMEIERMKKMGIALLCADDKYELAEQIADKVCFMEKGQIKWEGTTEDMVGADVLEKYLGVSHTSRTD